MSRDRSHRFNREAFYVRLDRERRNRRMSWNAIGRETGMSSASLTYLGQGSSLHADTLASLMAWLGETDLAPYITQPTGPRKPVVSRIDDAIDAWHDNPTLRRLPLWEHLHMTKAEYARWVETSELPGGSPWAEPATSTEEN